MNRDEKTGFEGLSHEVATLSQRVGTFETSVQNLLANDAATQRTIGRVVESLEHVNATVNDLSDKLDTARTRRTDPGAMASVVAVVITIGVLAAAPVYRDLERKTVFDTYVAEELATRSGVISRSTTRLDHVEGDIEALEGRMLQVEQSRFTAEDGARLEDLILRNQGR